MTATRVERRSEAGPNRIAVNFRGPLATGR